MGQHSTAINKSIENPKKKTSSFAPPHLFKPLGKKKLEPQVKVEIGVGCTYFI
jgi:hypothetical protein